MQKQSQPRPFPSPVAAAVTAVALLATARAAFLGERGIGPSGGWQLWGLLAVGVLGGIAAIAHGWKKRSLTALLAAPVAGVALFAMPLSNDVLVPTFYACAGAAALALWGLASHFSVKTVRFGTAIVLIGLSLVLVRVGRADLHQRNGAEARQVATSIDNELLGVSGALTELREAAATATTSLVEAVDVAAVSDLADSARAVVLALPTDIKKAGDALAELERGFANRTAKPSETALIEAARAAVGATRASAAAAKVDLMTPQKSIQALCEGGSGTIDKPAPEKADPCLVVDGRIMGERALDVRRAEATRDVTAARSKVTGSEDDKAAATKAAEVYAVAKTAEALPPSNTGVTNMLARGSHRVVLSLPPWRSRELPVVPETAGWLVVAIIGLLAYRALERHATRDDPGPVEVADLTGAPKGTTHLPALFKLHVLNNVPEPTAVPGTAQDDDVTKLLEAAGTPGKVIGPVLRALRGALAPARTHAVSAVYVGVTDEADQADQHTKEERHRVVVTLSTNGGVGGGAASVQTGASPEESVRAAGYWTAGWLLSRSGGVPPWARWNEETAEGLAAVYNDGATAPTIEDCVEAARLAPDSGLVLTMLGHRYDLAGRHRDALACYLRASTLYPRFPVARYRAAISLTFLASDLDGQWWGATQGELDHLVDRIGEWVARTGSGSQYNNELVNLRAPTPAGDDDAAATLAKVASAQLDGLSQRLERRPVLSDALVHRDERRYWLKLHTSDERDRLRWVARSARLACDKRSGQSHSGLLAEVKEAAQKPETWWQVVYNLACYYAVVGPSMPAEPEQSIHWLQRALSRRGTDQLTAEWLRKDPDLKSVRDDHRFDRVAASLPPQQRRADDGTPEA